MIGSSIIGRGESGSIFSQRNWKKRWFILDGGHLSYYEYFDTDKNVPVKKKGCVAVVGCKVVKVKHDDRKFTFALTHENRKPVKLAADDADTFHWWTKTLARAAVGALGQSSINFDPYFEVLGLDKDETLTSTMLNKAFRKKGITMHPDKEGGSEESFRLVQEAYDMLVSKLEADELAAKFEDITYTAKINKGGPGVGFGMVVVEDPKTHHVLVKSVLEEKMKLEEIDEAAGGQVLEGDRLVAVQEDDVSDWTLARVVQRLGDLRCPIGTSIPLQFVRKVLKDGEIVISAEDDMEENDLEKMENSEVTVENEKDKEDKVAAAAKDRAQKYKKRQSVADHLYTSSSSALTATEAIAADKPPRYSSHDFEVNVEANNVPNINESESDEDPALRESPPSDKPFHPSHDSSADALSEAAKELEMLKLMNSAMEASVSELQEGSSGVPKLSIMSSEKDQESNKMYEKIGDIVTDDIADVESLIPPGKCMELLRTETCVTRGIDINQRSALIAGVASMGWVDESKQIEFLESNYEDHMNNLNVLNETLKSYEMKQRMKNNASKTSGSITSSNGPKKALFKSRLSVVMNGNNKA